MLAHDLGAGSADKVSEDKQGHDRVIKRPQDGDELRDKVDGRGQPDDPKNQERLAPPWHPGVSHETFEQPEELGDKESELLRGNPTPGQIEDGDSNQPHRGGDRQPNEDPLHAWHSLTTQAERLYRAGKRLDLRPLVGMAVEMLRGLTVSPAQRFFLPAPRALVPTGKDPPEQAEAGALAPAVGIAATYERPLALHDPCGDAQDDVTDNRGLDRSLQHLLSPFQTRMAPAS
jgi:hypothetical protein